MDPPTSNKGVVVTSVAPPVYKKMFRAEKELIWRIERVHASCVTIDLEFLDLKISSTSNLPTQSIRHLSQHVSIRPDDFLLLDHSIKNTLRNISCMFQESIHADVTIETSDGSLRAHKAVLASSSPVFKSMFLHDFKEKQSSIIKIEDMSTDACSALLAYMYGAIKQDDFLKHCLPLLAAADKYDLQDLRKCCEEILLEDINSSNVFEKLRTARRYKLDKLTKGCLAYLFDFRRLPDVRGKLKDFFYDADRKLLREVFEETVANWKCC
ncbi:BTB/POZ domain-containing protein At1g21780-like [Zingiber officinale]|uniref:BTB/POZ domain-containing protein At1g21780-like n=1 Tax=Zingiber officinale TaxID=94328 RepID=UPI001C4C71CD|nr:BTB/POZ domain-containing protein At1g21780-like [Zingiber officinale]